MSLGGLCPGESLSGGLCLGGLCLGVSVQGALCQGDPADRDPPTYGNEQAVRILLECILLVLFRVSVICFDETYDMKM